ncbi:MAG TPA: shikimate dehydrogenase [Candidatus Anaerobiospirillum stercoravium]|nr:shikimate dehydrogenase [Candidatus Anaerobiospirillum stercoravium]
MTQPLKLAVFGNPIAHSISPLVHGIFAQQTGIAVDYGRIKVEGDFAAAAQAFFNAGGVGCNVTVPCKPDAYDLVDCCTPSAQLARVVNTIKVKTDDQGKRTLLGDNTDGRGLLTDLQRLGAPLAGASILIIGAGGATRGIVPPLLAPELGVTAITIVNRTVSKAQAIVQDMAELKAQLGATTTLRACSFDELKAQRPSPRFAVLLNATSLSLKGELPDLADEIYRHAACAYDLFYTPQGRTIFTEHCTALGIPAVYDGLGMLVGQAALSFALWTGVMPDVGAALAQVRAQLGK